MYAVLRRPADDLSSALAPRRARHPLASAFRTLDATSYTEIATVPVDRIVLDLAVSAHPWFHPRGSRQVAPMFRLLRTVKVRAALSMRMLSWSGLQHGRDTTTWTALGQRERRETVTCDECTASDRQGWQVSLSSHTMSGLHRKHAHTGVRTGVFLDPTDKSATTGPKT